MLEFLPMMLKKLRENILFDEYLSLLICLSAPVRSFQGSCGVEVDQKRLCGMFLRLSIDFSPLCDLI